MRQGSARFFAARAQTLHAKIAKSAQTGKDFPCCRMARAKNISMSSERLSNNHLQVMAFFACFARDLQCLGSEQEGLDSLGAASILF